MLAKSPALDTLVLSAGSQLKIEPWQLRGAYPAGSEATLSFFDGAGVLLAEFDGEVSTAGIGFFAEPSEVAGIPAGSSFTVMVSAPDEEPQAVRYGTVVRKEPRFPLKTVVAPESIAQQYTANFIGNYIGPMWRPMVGGSGTLIVHKTLFSGTDELSMGLNSTLYTKACARWLWPMNMDSVTINVRVVKAGTGIFNVIVCGDYELNSWLGVQFRSDVLTPNNNEVYAVTGSGPNAWVRRTTAVKHTVTTGNNYSVKYNFLSNTIALYAGTSTSPLVQWADTGTVVPHGAGYRYTGLSFEADLLSLGVEPTGWEARDGV